VRLLARKVQAGARFVLTQPVYSVEPLAGLRESYEKLTDEPLEIPVLAGVLPLVSSRHAGFLHNEVPGIEIPESARARMSRAGDDEDAAWGEGLTMAIELVASLRAADVAGVYVMPQFGRYDRAAEVVEAARGAATM
jgi:5,10-methylenetetrahydrofolate reductase